MSYLPFSTGIRITYSGIPQTPLIFSLAPPYVTPIPNVLISGLPATSPTTGPRIASFTYAEIPNANDNALIQLTFNDVAHVIGAFSPKSVNKLNTLSLPTLTEIGGNFGPTGLDALTSLSLPVLETVGANLRPSAIPALTTLSLPTLTAIGGTFECNNMNGLTGLSTPSLAAVYGDFIPNNINVLPSMSFPALQAIGGRFSPFLMTGMTGVFLTGMRRYESGINIPSGTMSGVVAAVFGTSGTLKAIIGSRIELSGLNLNVQSVTGLLYLLTSLDGTNGTVAWGAGKTLIINGGNNAAPAGQGIADKATLQGRGATVTTN